MRKSKPDYVVQNVETGRYDSFLRTYQTSISGPKIETQDLTPFKKSSISKANHRFEKRAEEIRKEAFEKKYLLYLVAAVLCLIGVPILLLLIRPL